MALKVNDIFEKMVQAAKKSLGENWYGIEDLVTWEFKKLSHNIVDIEEMKLNGSITEEVAQLQIDLQKNTMKTMMLTEVAIGILAVEAAINAAFNVVSVMVNKAIGWKIL